MNSQPFVKGVNPREEKEMPWPAPTGIPLLWLDIVSRSISFPTYDIVYFVYSIFKLLGTFNFFKLYYLFQWMHACV